MFSDQVHNHSKNSKENDRLVEVATDILHSISLKVDNPFDLIHFRSVCSFWRSSSLFKFQYMPTLRCPLPLDSGGYGDDCHIVSSHVYLLKSLNCDCPRYWLFKLQVNKNGEVDLQNLFTGTNSSVYKCVYPSLSVNLLNCQVDKLAQQHVAFYSKWCDPFDSVTEGQSHIGLMDLRGQSNEFMVLGVLSSWWVLDSYKGLNMYRSVNQHWTELETPEILFEGIVLFKGKFYAIDSTGRTTVVAPTLQVNTFQRSRPCDKTRKRWLITSEDKLLLVELCTETVSDFRRAYNPEKKIWFEVSVLNNEKDDWEQVKDLDGRVLFLEHYCSFSCLATDIPGFRANSIIFKEMWGRANSNKHESILVFEFGQEGVRSLRDVPGYIQLFPSPLGWVISNGLDDDHP